MINCITPYVEVRDLDEVRQFLNDEISRMGDKLLGFEITWIKNALTTDLAILSVGQPMTREEAQKGLMGKDMTKWFGRGMIVGYAHDLDGVHVDVIQKEGRRLYYLLRKDYPNLRRNLSRKE